MDDLCALLPGGVLGLLAPRMGSSVQVTCEGVKTRSLGSGISGMASDRFWQVSGEGQNWEGFWRECYWGPALS